MRNHLALMFLIAVSTLSAQTFNNLTFRFIGVDVNRASAVVGEPGNPMVSYVGAASGGIFKT